MRLVLHPGGIVACLFVWACLFVVKAATNVLFFNILFSDVSAVDGAASGREPFSGAQQPFRRHRLHACALV